MRRGLRITSLPYEAVVYINNQVLIPANLVRTLGIEHLRYADITLEFNGFTVELRGVRLLRPKNTASRQFTIPRSVRETYGIMPFHRVKVVKIEPSSNHTTEGGH